jgi:hypothetical protein
MIGLPAQSLGARQHLTSASVRQLLFQNRRQHERRNMSTDALSLVSALVDAGNIDTRGSRWCSGTNGRMASATTVIVARATEE